MAITVEELYDSRRATLAEKSTMELKFRILGTSDDLAAVAALQLEAPITYDGLYAQSYGIDPKGDDWWYGTVRYGSVEPPSTTKSKYSFNTTGATTKMTQSLATVGSYAPPDKSAPDFQGAIGFDGKTVQGADITIATYKWTEQHYPHMVFVDSAYRTGLANMTGTVNAIPFREFGIGEVLFLGAVGSYSEFQRLWDITYSFAAEPNMASLSIGSIAGIAKAGWDYLWVLYEEIDDETNKKLISRPRAAYVEQVYRRTDFTALGIGTTPIT